MTSPGQPKKRTSGLYKAVHGHVQKATEALRCDAPPQCESIGPHGSQCVLLKDHALMNDKLKLHMADDGTEWE